MGGFGNTSEKNCILESAGPWYPPGYEHFLKAVLGHQGTDYFRVIEEKNRAWFHPMHLTQFFAPTPIPQTAVWSGHHPEKTDFSRVFRNITGLSKLLLYPTYARAKARDLSIALTDVVKEELNTFPYTQQDNFKVKNCV